MFFHRALFLNNIDRFIKVLFFINDTTRFKKILPISLNSIIKVNYVVILFNLNATEKPVTQCK